MDYDKIIKDFYDMESSYKVENVKVSGLEIWGVLRSSYFSALSNKNEYIESRTKKNKIRKILAKLKKFKNAFYGIINIFRFNNFKYIIFTDTYEQKIFNKVYIDKMAEGLIEILGYDNVLIIENPINGYHYKRAQTSLKNVISLDLFNFLCILLNLVPKKYKINNDNILLNIDEIFGINVSYELSVKFFFSYVNLFKYFFKIIRPEAIFLNNYDSIHHKSAIYAAKKLSIKTIELQHGFISNKHFSYNISKPLNNNIFPDYLLSYGNYIRKYFGKENYFINKSKVLPVGSYYVELINKKYKPEIYFKDKLKLWKKKYKNIIVISSQITIEKDLLEFIQCCSQNDRNNLYLFVPRDLDKKIQLYGQLENLIVWRDKIIDIYKIIKFANFHATVYSTCALEAPALGTPNIMININNLSKKIFGDILIDKRSTKYVDTINEFVKVIQEWNPLPKCEIKKIHEDFFVSNYNKNIKYALKVIFEH